MEEKFRKHIKQHFPFLFQESFCIAVSGGIDSMVLVELFRKLNASFTLLHCNFQLRGKESDADMEFVRDCSKKYHIPVAIVQFDTKRYAEEQKLSTQLAARELRYNWFAEQLAETKTHYLLTAHHADDSLETFMINLSRGTGLDGLLGIPAVNGTVVRPLLPFTRAEISAYAAENKIAWREDSSNASDDYLRNQIRHKLTPVLNEIHPNFQEAFQKTIYYLQQSKSMADDAANLVFMQVAKEVGDAYHFDIAQLEKLPNRNAYLFYWLQRFGFTAWEDIYNLSAAQSGKQVFSPTHTLLKDRDYLILSLKKNGSRENYLIDKKAPGVNIPLKFAFCNVSDISEANSNRIFVDEDQLDFPLTLRKWEEGDYFYPFGMKGRKKLSKYFKDEKMPLPEKSATWLLCSGNQIVWVVGKRQDDRFKITKNTTKILQISLDP